MESFNLFLSFVLTYATCWCLYKHPRKQFLVKTTHSELSDEFHECFQSKKCWTFCICQKIWLLKNMPIYAKFAKPKIFMPTISKKSQFSKIWHKNMPAGNTGWVHYSTALHNIWHIKLCISSKQARYPGEHSRQGPLCYCFYFRQFRSPGGC